MSDVRRRMPRTDALLAESILVDASRTLGTSTVKATAVRAQQRARRHEIAPETVADAAAAELPGRACGMWPVINPIGVAMHTNLGRAPLSEDGAAATVVDAVRAVAGCR